MATRRKPKASVPINPRSSAGQSGAARPENAVIGGAALSTQYLSGVRGAEAQAAVQNQNLSSRGTRGTAGLSPTAGMQDVSAQIVPGTNFTYADIGIHSLP